MAAQHRKYFGVTSSSNRDFAPPTPGSPEDVARKSKRKFPLANARPAKDQPKKAKTLSDSGRSTKTQAVWSTQAIVAIVAMIALEAVFHASVVRRLARQRLPGESTRGIAWYVAKRSIRLRSSRIPPARVARGDAI